MNMDDKDAIIVRTNQQEAAALEEREHANRHFRIKLDDREEYNGPRYLLAEADTGWRYAIVITPLPSRAVKEEGGPMLVTVLSPWQDAWALQRTGYLSEKYVNEHLRGGYDRSPADIRALTLLVRAGLDREGDLE